ncbi:ATP-dependent Clp protease ATP-binding subunit ClpX, partial [bacterium]
MKEAGPDVKDLTCSFCGRGKEEVSGLVTGPEVNICDECIEVCGGILAER